MAVGEPVETVGDVLGILEIGLRECQLGIAVNRLQNDVVGHAVIIHANEDDMTTQDPTNPGKSGKRIAGGVIEAKK